jgi:hypothetical protein
MSKIFLLLVALTLFLIFMINCPIVAGWFLVIIGGIWLVMAPFSNSRGRGAAFALAGLIVLLVGISIITP